MRSSRSAADPLLAGSAGFAHRGLHGPGVPENSLAAFRAAVDLGAGIECDLRLSHDGFPMVFHDQALDRMCGIEADLSAQFATSLMAMRLAGTDQCIPWLGDLLDLVQGQVPILLELKFSPGSIEALCKAVASWIHRYRGPVAVMSFEPAVGAWFAVHQPGVRRGLVLGSDDLQWERDAKLKRSQAGLAAIGIDVIGDPWVAEWRRDKADILCWTVRTPEQRRQAQVHADALIWEGDGRP